ncbi:MAG: cupin domain-containing protein [Methanothrix sp.]|jgi:mannose-6-phosphate isomerase-like protein (cupin superfamily)|nr:cupin domain-containing protein [Methanothrix sp.]
MILKDLAKCRYFRAADNTFICELLHPDREGLDLPYSIAHAMLQPGAASLPHRLKTSSEVYFILVGVGEMHIDSEKALVQAGQAVLIPPGSWQHILNTGDIILKFICIVNPFWRAQDEEVLENETIGVA